MRVVDRLARREETWKELDGLLRHLRLPGPYRPGTAPTPAPHAGDMVWIDADAAAANPYLTGRSEPTPTPATPPPARPLPATRSEAILRMAELYRSACADLMLAEAYDLPRETVVYLHDLVARAHNVLYRSRGFRFATWAGELFRTVPRQLRSDPALRLAALLFWGPFLISCLIAAARPEFARTGLGPEMVAQLEEMYAEPIGANTNRDDAAMAGFYVFNNAGIGLRCFAWGLSFGLGTIYLLTQNGITLGLSFGHMLTTPFAANFYHFVTAHSAFELTAIVFAGAAGLRLGWGLIDHRGQTRLASLRREAAHALPIAGASVFLFVLAAFLEGFVSASGLPYAVKAAIAVVSAAILVAYLLLGGRSIAGPVGEE